jgi:hypothetical protein
MYTSNLIHQYCSKPNVWKSKILQKFEEENLNRPKMYNQKHDKARLYNNNNIYCLRATLLMTILLTLREARGNTILWEYRGPSVPVYVMAGSVVPLMIYLCFGPGVHTTTTV